MRGVNNIPTSLIEALTPFFLRRSSLEHFDAANLGSGSASNGKVLTADGSDGASWEYPPIWLNAEQFYTSYGSPARGVIGASGSGLVAGTWLLDDSAAAEIVGASVPLRNVGSGSTIYVDIYWAMESATSGNVVLGAGVAAIADGEDLTAVGNIATSTVAVPGTAKHLKKTTITVTHTYADDDLLRVCLIRYGSNASDTATGDLHIIAAGVRLG